MSYWTTALAILVAVFSSSCATTTPEPRLADAKTAWIEALASGNSHQVWTMLGESARSQFTSEDEFSEWCELYCPQLLVDAATMENHTLFAKIGQARVVKVGQNWRVDRAQNIPSYGTLKAALGSLHTFLVQLIQSNMLTDSAERKIRAFSVDLARASTDIDEQSRSNRLELDIGDGMVVLERTDSGWKLAVWKLPVDQSAPD